MTLALLWLLCLAKIIAEPPGQETLAATTSTIGIDLTIALQGTLTIVKWIEAAAAPMATSASSTKVTWRVLAMRDSW